MSRDIFVQDIPPNVSQVSEIPSDFQPQPLRLSHDDIVATIQRIVPGADFSDPDWGTIDGEGFSIEVNIKRDEPMRSFAFHVRSEGMEADVIIGDILDALGLQAFDIGSETGLFEDPART